LTLLDRLLHHAGVTMLQPDSNPALYVSSVLALDIDLADTPLRASASRAAKLPRLPPPQVPPSRRPPGERPKIYVF
jgi:hypothetical protein